jgi:hypothetical protein
MAIGEKMVKEGSLFVCLVILRFEISLAVLLVLLESPQ